VEETEVSKGIHNGEDGSLIYSEVLENKSSR
jgi:hypothetical protein